MSVRRVPFSERSYYIVLTWRLLSVRLGWLSFEWGQVDRVLDDKFGFHLRINEHGYLYLAFYFWFRNWVVYRFPTEVVQDVVDYAAMEHTVPITTEHNGVINVQYMTGVRTTRFNEDPSYQKTDFVWIPVEGFPKNDPCFTPFKMVRADGFYVRNEAQRLYYIRNALLEQGRS